MSAGHVFVVRGLLGGLDHDAVVIGTDRAFRVEMTWCAALGVSEHDPARIGWHEKIRRACPESWDTNRWGRIRADQLEWDLPEPAWFLDVARYDWSDVGAERDAGLLIERLSAVLASIAAASIVPLHERPRPLIAIPTLGVSKGGFGQFRGSLIDKLLEVCHQGVAEHGFDIALVAADAADHAAFQTHRRRLGLDQELDPDETDTAQRLAEQARDGTLALFLGAGVSMSAGLPSWTKLIERLADLANVKNIDDLASPLDQAQLLRTVMGDELGVAVARIVAEEQRYGLAHALLASLECDRVVTTNYDGLYERAVGDRVEQEPLLVLPYGDSPPRNPWLLKMHGDAALPKTIVLSRSDFVGYQARSGPVGSVVQSLMMTQHLLVVGSSMTDDNFLRLAHEVIAFREPKHPLGTVLTFTANEATRRLWATKFDYLAVAGGVQDDGERARRLAIFLDMVAMLATRPAHLLDERYASLLPEQARAVSEQARALASAIDGLDGPGAEPFRELRTVLRNFGAAPS